MSTFADIEAYLESLAEPLRSVAQKAAELIDAQRLGSRAVWYGHPVWSLGPAPKDNPVCYLKAFSKQVALGFWDVSALDDPSGFIKPGANGRGTVALRTTEDLTALPVAEWIAQARAAQR